MTKPFQISKLVQPIPSEDIVSGIFAIDCTCSNGKIDPSAPRAERFAIDCNHARSALAGPEQPAGRSAINCISELQQTITDLVTASMADNTRRGYLADLNHFLAWGGALPATADLVAAYLAAHAGQLRTATLTRRMAALSKTHEANDWPNPCRAEKVRVVMRGIKRKHGQPQKQAKALTRDDLFLVLERMGDRMRDVRDQALLLLGFAGAFRRSELVGIRVEDIEHVPQGIIITLPRSKTDQGGEGRKVAIPFGRTRHCPVKLLAHWIEKASIAHGPLFRPVNRGDFVGADALSAEAVSTILRERLEAAGFNSDGYSGHSLRAGFATSAAQVGAQAHKIRAQTGHASDAMLARYIREGELFTGNAAGAVL